MNYQDFAHGQSESTDTKSLAHPDRHRWLVILIENIFP